MKTETKHLEKKKAKQPYEQPQLETREKLAEVAEGIVISGPVPD